MATPRVPPPEIQAPHDRWSLDFVSDRLADGRPFRVLTLLDHVSRLLAARSAWTGQQVTQFFDQAFERCGRTQMLQMDNGPEFAGKALDAWAYRSGIQLCVSRPGKPTDNAYCESFNGKLRAEFLDAH